MEYWLAVEVEDIIEQYIKYHPELIGATFGCIFKEKASKSDGQPIVGKISKVSDRDKVLMSEPYDYRMEIGYDAWVELNNAQKEAWVDHLLEHAYGEENEKDGSMSWKLRKPEISAFPVILSRHGIHWMPHLAKLAHNPAIKKAIEAAEELAEEGSEVDEVKDQPTSKDLDDLMQNLN